MPTDPIVLGHVPGEARVTALHAAGAEVWVAAREAGGSTTTVIGVLEGGSFDARLAVPDADCWELAVTPAWVYAVVSRKRERELWRLPRGAGPGERIAGPIELPAIATTAGGELVYGLEGQIVIRDDAGTERGLLSLSGPGEMQRMEVEHRRQGRMEIGTTDVRATVARVAMASALVCTADDVYYAANGDATARDRVYRVPLAGGAPEVWLEGRDESAEVSEQLGPIAILGDRIATFERRAARGGRILGAALVFRTLADRSEIARHPGVATTPRSVRALGTTLAWSRRASPTDASDRIEASLDGGPPQRIAERTGEGLALAPGALLFGHGAEVHRVELPAPGGPALSAREQDVLHAIRTAGGAYEVTTVAGRPAIRTLRADGSRAIQVISDTELENIRRALE